MLIRKRGHQTLYGATSRQNMVIGAEHIKALKERDNADQLTKKRKLYESEKLAVYVNGTPTLEAFIENKKKYQPDNATQKSITEEQRDSPHGLLMQLFLTRRSIMRGLFRFSQLYLSFSFPCLSYFQFKYIIYITLIIIYNFPGFDKKAKMI